MTVAPRVSHRIPLIKKNAKPAQPSLFSHDRVFFLGSCVCSIAFVAANVEIFCEVFQLNLTRIFKSANLCRT